MDRPTVPLSQKRILVVAQSEEIRSQVLRHLGVEGYIVMEASGGQAGIEAMRRLKPDLILASFPGDSNQGIEFYQDVHQNPDWIAIPFIFLVPPESMDLIHTGRELGVEDTLELPIDPHRLVSTVSSRLLRAAELRIALIDQAYLDTVKMLANTIEGRDPYTHGHVDRVTMYARWLAEALDWPDEQLRILEFGARLHDIGKIMVPDQILNKPGALAHNEWIIMKQHPSAGARMLRNIPHLTSAIPYVLHHHERWDGSGYPQGLCGREIPLEGRLLAIVDVYDALTTSRPYHPARPPSEVLDFIASRAGAHFDPDLTPIFVQVMHAKLNHRHLWVEQPLRH